MRHCFLILLGFAVLTALVGCNKAKETAETEPELPDWLAEDEGSSLDDEDPEAMEGESDEFADELADDSGEPGELNARVASRSAKSAGSRRERPGKLELKLNEGDRFPLRKVIDVELTQAALDGQPEVSRRTLDMMLMITVGETIDEKTRLQVRYDRIHYIRDVAGGDHLEYDSRQPPSEVPFAVRMYHDMVKDGFSFWINDKNQIVESDDFRTFLTRCLRNIPEDKRQQVLLEVEGTGENGITDFIDNSIGLLPFGYHKAGDSWQRTRNVTRPVPMVIENTYTLKDLDRETAVIGVTGQIAPSTTVSEAAATDEVRVSITGGMTTGSCTVFRDTGLPRESHVSTIVEMVVQTGAIQFSQQQKTETRIESYPAAGGSTPAVISAAHETGDGEESLDEPPPPRPRRKSTRLK